MNLSLLQEEITREHRKWSRSTKLYGVLYPLTRTYLIVTSGLVAAKETLGGQDWPRITETMSLLAVTVTIVTALDTWLRPRDRWRGFMRDRDDLADLRIEVDGSKHPDEPAVQALHARFVELRKRHRDENVF